MISQSVGGGDVEGPDGPKVASECDQRVTGRLVIPGGVEGKARAVSVN